jgi:tetratricopeptide (TPR) repeat protein
LKPRARAARTAIAATLFALAFALAFARDAHAQSAPLRPALQQRFEHYLAEAQAAYARGDSAAAIISLEHAYGISPVPMLLFNIARAEELAGHLSNAIDYYDRFLATNPPAEQADGARSARANAQASLDAQHPQANGGRPSSGAPHGGPSHTAPVQPHGPRRIRPEHIAFAGAGAAMLITGTVFGGLALGASGQFAHTADPALRASLQDTGTAFAWTANAGFLLGVGLAAVGVVMYILQPTAPRETYRHGQ